MNRLPLAFVMILNAFSTNVLFAQAETEPRSAPNASVLDEEQWKQLDHSVKRGLEWLITQQKDDGSFETIDRGQPGVTAFCVMAFLAQGESPIDGNYQRQTTEAINFIADQQKPNGLIAVIAPDAVPIPRLVVPNTGTTNGRIGRAAVYNHAISALAVCEAYGQCNPEQSTKLKPVIEKAIKATLEMQRWGNKRVGDVGGWRYLNRQGIVGGPFKSDSDLSITGWQLMFLRSARNAGFDVPKERIDQAVSYVENCYLANENRKVHGYLVGNSKAFVLGRWPGRESLALAHAGKHELRSSVGIGRVDS